jgi:PAS domain S-box-containing protein
MLKKVFFTKNHSHAVKMPFKKVKKHLYPYLETSFRKEKTFDFIHQNIEDVIWIYSISKNRFTYISPSVLQLRGFTVDEAKNQSLQQTLHEEDYEYIVQHMGPRIMHFEAGNMQLKTLVNEIRQPRKNGSFTLVEIATTLITNSKGKVTDILGVTRDISHRAEDKPLLKLTQGLFETAFDFTRTGIALIDEFGHIINANKGFCMMVGYPKHYVLQKSFYDFVVKGDEPCLEEVFNAARKEKSFEKQSEIRLLNLHNEIIWGLLNVTGVKKSDQDEKLTWVIQIQDTTDRKRNEEIIKSLYSDLQLKNLEMEQLIYLTSHDLRSPLVNIRGFSKELINSFNDLNEIVPDLLPDDKESITKWENIKKDIEESFNFIGISVKKMDMLLGGLLRYSRLGKQMTTPANISMNELVADVIKAQEYVIKNNNLRIEISDLPPCFASEEMINQAFSNLLENAIKYQDNNRIGIIKIWGNQQDNISTYCVEDNGIGIPHEHHEKIFELFARLHPQKANGEGLGLSIVKKILELNGGKISLESQWGIGSKFFIHLPAIKKAEKTP